MDTAKQFNGTLADKSGEEFLEAAESLIQQIMPHMANIKGNPKLSVDSFKYVEMLSSVFRYKYSHR